MRRRKTKPEAGLNGRSPAVSNPTARCQSLSQANRSTRLIQGALFLTQGSANDGALTIRERRYLPRAHSLRTPLVVACQSFRGAIICGAPNLFSGATICGAPNLFQAPLFVAPYDQPNESAQLQYKKYAERKGVAFRLVAP